MFVRKLNCLQKRRHFYAFFEPLKREASVEGQNARRGGVLACFALEFARLKEIGKKRQRLFCRLISQTNLRGRCREGREKARRGSSCEFLSTCFFPRLRLPCRLNNTEFNSSIYMAILRTTLSDIRTWQKKIVFPPRAPSVRSKSAMSIPYKSNRRLFRDQTRRQTVISIPVRGERRSRKERDLQGSS